MPVSTAERITIIQPAHKFLGRRETSANQAISREQLITDIKASQARFERGENDDNDVWALEKEMRIYALNISSVHP